MKNSLQEFLKNGAFLSGKRLSDSHIKPPPVIADPFLYSLNGEIYIFAEHEYFQPVYKKKIGHYKLNKESEVFEFAGEIFSDNDLEYSFPFVIEHDAQLFMVPDVNDKGGEKLINIYRSKQTNDLSNWELVGSLNLKSVKRPTDKVVFFEDGLWWMLISDASAGGSLIIFWSESLWKWTDKKSKKVVHRSVIRRLLERLLPRSIFRYKPWRLAGGVIRDASTLSIPLQDQKEKKLYGESVSWFDINFNVREKQNFEDIMLMPSKHAGLHPTFAFPSAEGIHHYSEIEFDRSTIGVLDIQNNGGWDSIVALAKH